jgi:hypothetical protein
VKKQSHFANSTASAVLVALIVGPALVLLSVRLSTDESLDTSERGHTASVLASPTSRTVTDERQLRIFAVAIVGPEIPSGAARGTVTAVIAEPDARMADGELLFQVDGIDCVGFASSLPLYRSIAPGTEGEDVAELHRLLVLLGVLDAPPGNPRLATLATGQAIGDFAESIGAARSTTFDPAWVVWLPEKDLVVESVKLKVGQQAPVQGTGIITTPGRVTSARLTSANQEPLTFAPGVEYIAIVDGEEFALDTAAQSIAEADLPRLRTPKETERDGIPATTRRKTPLQALAVPSSAVMTNEKSTLCLWLPAGRDYRPVTITVAGARGGVTNVASGLSADQQVLSNPAQVLEEPQCP